MIHPNSEIQEFDIVIIGSTGDLSIKKILPALMRRFLDGQIPENSNIFCIGRQQLSTDNFLDNLMVKLRKKGNIAGKEEYKFNMMDYIPNFISKINISCLVGMELGENENFITDFTKIEHGINMTSSLPPFLSWFLLIQAKNAFKRFQGI